MQKPSKPHPSFPLYAHASGQWAKKIKGKAYYFGKWEDPQAALRRYLAEKDYLLAGQVPPSESGHSISYICDRYLQSRLVDVKTGELEQGSFDKYQEYLQFFSDLAGDKKVEHLTQADLRKIREKMAEGVGTSTLSNRVRIARMALRWSRELTGQEFQFGKFREPGAKAKRKARAEAGAKMVSREDILRVLDAANPDMKAMVLLGINCAFGNTDCSKLEWKYVDMEGGWHSFARPKTYVPRKAKLWPETVEALAAVKGSGERVFTTKYGNPWKTTAIAHECEKLGIRYYDLRRTFRTVADETLETMAIRMVMGHTPREDDMDSRYVQSIKDERLEVVARYVRAWLLLI